MINVNAEAVLTLRSTVRGVRSLVVSDSVKLQSGTSILGPFGYVLFVHGFNNSHEQARTSYARFRGWLGKFNANARVLELHWPGDGIGLMDALPRTTLAGAASYPFQVRRAVKCGKLLANWLESSPSKSRFILVGHSLGCRLILETLKAMSPQHLKRIFGVCLMAAAVPVRKIKSEKLGPIHSEDCKWRVLHSRGDMVLGAVFHFGQPFDSIFTRAVGYLGDPKEKWSSVGEVEEMYDIRNGSDRFYGHGWYWSGGRVEAQNTDRSGGPESLPPIRPPRQNDGRSAMVVAKLLGVCMERSLNRREQPFGRVIAPNRDFWNR